MSKSVAVGSGASANFGNDIAFGDNTTTTCIGDVVIGDVLFGETIPWTVREMIHNHPENIYWILFNIGTQLRKEHF